MKNGVTQLTLALHDIVRPCTICQVNAIRAQYFLQNSITNLKRRLEIFENITQERNCVRNNMKDMFSKLCYKYVAKVTHSRRRL